MPFPGAKYPPPPGQKTCFAVAVEFFVNATTYTEATRLLVERLPNPEADGHAVIDSWYVADGSDL